MHLTTYPDATAFLHEAQIALEASGSASDRMLGMCLRMVRHPERIGTPPLFVTAGDDEGLALAAVMAPPWNVVIHGLRDDIDAAARALAAYLQAERRSAPGVEGPAEVAALAAARLAEASGRRPRLERREHLYELRAVCTPVPIDGRLRVATEPDAPLIAGWWHGSSLAAFGRADAAESERVAHRCIADGDVYVWDVGRPVSMAVQTGPTRTGITVGRVYTPPEERGHGFATACVGELSRWLLAQGPDHCILFVEASNAAAQRLYLRVGYRPVAEFLEFALER